MAKIVSMVVKLGALGFVLFLDNSVALNLQLLGGLWILQTFPAVVFGLFTRWFSGPALRCWPAGLSASSVARTTRCMSAFSRHAGGVE